MDIAYLLKILARRKWLIFSVMLASAAAMYVFIGKKPEMYRASVMVSTGIVNYKGINSDNSDAFVQEYQVENAFSNLIEFTQSRAAVKLLTIRMLRHDLSAEGGSAEKPFRKPNFSLSNFTPGEAQKLLEQLNGVNLDSISDPAFSQEFDYLLDKIARAYGYDHDAIRRSLEIKRKGETDLLTIDVVTEKDSLSQFIANTYTNQFMVFYQNLRQRENKNKVDFFTELAGEKHATIDTVKEQIYNYRRSKGLATFNKQAEDLVNQISILRNQRQRAMSKSASSEASVKKLDGYIDDKQSLYADETRDRVVDKYAIIEKKEIRDRLETMLREKGGKDPILKKQLEEADVEYINAMKQSSRSIGERRNQVREEGIKDDLYSRKVDTDLEGIDANKSVAQLDREIGYLQGQLKEYVSDDESINHMTVDLERKQEEFTKLNEKLNDARLAFQTNENPLHIVENAQFPEWPEGNRQTLLSVFAGIVAATLTTIFLFLLAYFDSSIMSPIMFKKYTNDLPLMGAVNTVPLKNLDFKQVFSTNGEMPQYNAFRENLRKLRTQILQSTGRVFLFVSTKPQEGKSFTMNALAHSLAANNKRVLLLDTNFKNATLSRFADEPSPNSSVLNRALREHGLTEIFQLKNNSAGFDLKNVDVLGNTGLHLSPIELLDPMRFRNFLTDLSETYDYIFMEAAALNIYSDARELVQFADRVIAVFNAGSVIKSADQESLEFLAAMNGKFAGSVLTDVDVKNMA